jgi:Rieske Fe-S protein
MDGMRAVVRLAVLAGVLVLGAVAFLPAVHDVQGVQLVVQRSGEDASPMAIPNATGYYLGAWNHLPVAVIVTTEVRLAGVDALRGPGSATPSIAVPGHPGLRMFALSAKSTHLGCTVGFRPGLGASRDIADYDGDGLPDGRMMDPCSQSQWDPYDHGKVLPGQPAKVDLAALDLRIEDGKLVGTHYDGPVGPPPR